MKRIAKSIALVFSLFMLSSAVFAAGSEVSVELNKGEMVRMSRLASSIIVADPTIADIQVISPHLLFVHGKKVGETSITAIDSNDMPILNMTVTVTHNLSKLRRELSASMPDSNVQFSTVDNGLVLRGSVRSPAESENVRTLAASFLGEKDKLVNMLSIEGSDQVMLRVKVAEVSRNELKRFGISLSSLFDTGNFAFQVVQGRQIFDNTTGRLLRSGNDNSILVQSNGRPRTTSGVIDALETQGFVTVLAEPNLTTTSGKPASFLAGGEYPVPASDGNGGVTISYKQYGIGLSFTPVVLSREKISLTVAPEVSTIASVSALQTSSGVSFPIPTLQTRRASTTVELGSGQSFAIAGLLKNDRNNNVDKFPGLGDMPILGELFRSQQFQNDQTELVILVTPYVVRPVSEGKLQTPLDGYDPADDMERITEGKLYREHDAGDDGKHDENHSGPEKNVGAEPRKPVAEEAVAEEAIDLMPQENNAPATEAAAPKESKATPAQPKAPAGPKLHGDAGFVME